MCFVGTASKRENETSFQLRARSKDSKLLPESLFFLVCQQLSLTGKIKNG